MSNSLRHFRIWVHCWSMCAMAVNNLDSVPSEIQRAQEIWERIYVKNHFRAIEVLSHRQPNDFWIIFFGRILNLTEITKAVNQLPADDENYKVYLSNDWIFCNEFKCKLFFSSHKATKALQEFGGIEVEQLCTPRNFRTGIFGLKSSSAYGIANNLYWWNDPTYVIGMLTTRERKVMVLDKSEGIIQCKMLFLLLNFCVFAWLSRVFRAVFSFIERFKR